MTDHDKAIIEAAERCFEEWKDSGLNPVAKSLINAVAAKREALRPKLMTGDEAWCLWGKLDGLDAVLTEVHARAFRVIEHALRAGGYIPTREETIAHIRIALGIKP